MGNLEGIPDIVGYMWYKGMMKGAVREESFTLVTHLCEELLHIASFNGCVHFHTKICQSMQLPRQGLNPRTRFDCYLHQQQWAAGGFEFLQDNPRLAGMKMLPQAAENVSFAESEISDTLTTFGGFKFLSDNPRLV